MYTRRMRAWVAQQTHAKVPWGCLWTRNREWLWLHRMRYTSRRIVMALMTMMESSQSLLPPTFPRTSEARTRTPHDLREWPTTSWTSSSHCVWVAWELRVGPPFIMSPHARLTHVSGINYRIRTWSCVKYGFQEILCGKNGNMEGIKKSEYYSYSESEFGFLRFSSLWDGRSHMVDLENPILTLKS